MSKLIITGKETEIELAEKLTNHLALLCVEMVKDVILTAQSVPSGLKELGETQLRAQKAGDGAMKAHFIYYVSSLLPKEDQTCLLTGLFQGASMEEIEKKEPVIWLPTRGEC